MIKKCVFIIAMLNGLLVGYRVLACGWDAYYGGQCGNVANQDATCPTCVFISCSENKDCAGGSAGSSCNNYWVQGTCTTLNYDGSNCPNDCGTITGSSVANTSEQCQFASLGSCPG